MNEDRNHGSHPASTNSGHQQHHEHAGDEGAAVMGGAGSSGGHSDHDKHEGHDPEAFRRLFWISFLLTIPVVVFSPTVQEWFGYSLDSIPGHSLVSPILGTLVFIHGGRVFLQGGWHEVLARQPGMMLLISLAITVAFGASVLGELDLIDIELWWELAALITVMQLGHWQEMKALGQTRGALAALADLLPDDAEVIVDGGTERVPVGSLRNGDVVLIRPGARVPGDGEVVDGQADMDESLLTGESRPVARGTGDRVTAGTVAHGSAIQVRLTATGDSTALAGIQRLVAEAQSSRSRAQAIADRAAAALFFIAVAAGALTFTAWSLLGNPDAAIVRTVTVLVIACPHALGLAIPLVVAFSTEVAARNGILVKDRLSLERTRTVDVVLFDKTGTLTRGTPAVTGIWAADGDEAALIRLAGAAENVSEHPLARAIVTRALEYGELAPATDFAADPGRGVVATVQGTEVRVGGPQLLRFLGMEEGSDNPRSTEWTTRGATVLHVVRDGTIVGALALEDEVRPESRAAVRDLHRAGLRVAMVTGDAENVAKSVASELDIDEVFAEVLPEDKEKKVSELQQRGLRVAMVGDGVNDAPALARADVGIAIGAGADVAIESAGVVLASDDPRSVLGVIRLSRAAYRKMVQNLIWATGYNVVAIPLAAGVLAFAGIVMPPAGGALLMSLSTIVVAFNAQTLRRLDLRPAE